MIQKRDVKIVLLIINIHTFSSTLHDLIVVKFTNF